MAVSSRDTSRSASVTHPKRVEFPIYLLVYLICGTVLATALPPVIMAIIYTAYYPHCLLGFDSVDTFVLPDFRNLSKSESSELSSGHYPLPQKYFLRKVVNVDNERYRLCVLTNPSDFGSACMPIGHVNHSIPCNQDMRAECLPGAIVDSYFGISVWNLDQASVQYLIITTPKSHFSSTDVSSQSLTDTTKHLSDVWYRALGCQGVIALDISTLIALVLAIIITCVVCVGCCCRKLKRNRKTGECTSLLDTNVQRTEAGAAPRLGPDPQPVRLQDIEEQVVPKVAADWEQLAIYLGVEPALLGNIKKNNSCECREGCRDMLCRWIESKRGTGRQPRTWDSVVRAIRRMGREDLAEQLRRRYM